MKELWRGLVPQLQVIYALILRETRTRFGRHHLGYVWALVEPLLWIGMIWAIFDFTGRTAPAGMTVISFLATGVVPFLMFRNTVSRASGAVASNKGLLFYPQVRPLDLTAARVGLEIVTIFVVFALIVLGEALVVGNLEIDHTLELLLGFGLAAGFGASLGLVLSSLSVFSSAVDRVSSVLMRPFFWCSGLFFTANGLPSNVRDVFLYNPVFHAIDLVRAGWFYEYTAEHTSALYPLGCILVLTFFGLTLERVARRRLEIA